MTMSTTCLDESSDSILGSVVAEWVGSACKAFLRKVAAIGLYLFVLVQKKKSGANEKETDLI